VSQTERPAEIHDWVHALGRGVAILIIIPLVAGAIAGVIALRQPKQYKTGTTVVIPHPATFGPASVAVSQSVDDFQGVLTSDAVATQTSQQTGAPISHIQSGLSSQRRGSSNAVDVTYTGTSQTVAPQVVVAASKNALGAQAQANLTLAQGQLSAAEAAYKDALDSYTKFATAHNVVDISASTGAYEKQLKDAITALDQATASGDKKAIAKATAEITKITRAGVTLRAGYQSAQDKLNAAKAGYVSAQSATIQAQGEVAAAQAVDLVASPVVAVPRATHVAKRVIPAMIAGLVLALGILVLIELIRPSGKRAI
jgi:hypothetical protein